MLKKTLLWESVLVSPDARQVSGTKMLKFPAVEIQECNNRWIF